MTIYINLSNRKAIFKYEDLQVARQLFEKGFYMFSFDIRGAYNHIDIIQPHRTLLGFSWPGGGKEACLQFIAVRVSERWSYILQSSKSLGDFLAFERSQGSNIFR